MVAEGIEEEEAMEEEMEEVELRDELHHPILWWKRRNWRVSDIRRNVVW